MITFGSLFAGIGGIDLGFERVGMLCKWQVERDPYCQKVLNKHWPDVPVYDDVCDVGSANLEAVDLICGGFPCQDISNAGLKAGIEGERSGLWSEFARIIRELRPRYVIVENVAALLNRGIDRVLGDLAACGYDAEWQVLSACRFGATHVRNRLFVIAYADSAQCKGRRIPCGAYEKHADARGGSWWETESGVDRMAYGVPGQSHRLRAIGNAVVPQVAEFIGRQIVEWENTNAAKAVHTNN